MTKSVFLFGAIALGIVFPQGHHYAGLIRYLIMLILFCSLLELRIDPKSALNPRLGIIVVTMTAVAGIAAWIGNWFSPDLAQVAFLIAMAPTAAAAPVMTQFLNGRVEYVMSSVVVTTLFSAVMLPLVLPLLSADNQAGFSLADLFSTLQVVLLPLLLTQLLQKVAPRAVKALSPLKKAGFYLWLTAIYLATTRDTHFIETESTASWSFILAVAGVALALCTVNFGLGRWLGGCAWAQEMGQSLGQKNTMFIIWVALNFLTPAIALGPMFYIVFQNLYNSYLLSQQSRRNSAKS
jgi:BASS family bile acid:Na+ symporter